jgi:N-acetylglucosaminyldiphosphoundecaprenol N-acetyl-beta-D-mannosaminyltransferase
MIMEAQSHPELRAAIQNADLVLPDGAPVAWAVRRNGSRWATRIPGPDFMATVCAEAASRGIPIALLGGQPATLDRLTQLLPARYPQLDIAYHHSPPFRSLSEVEVSSIRRRILASRAHLLFVGLGCPKQEIWMSQHRSPGFPLMFGVGAAFDFISGEKRRAPRWIRGLGLEWAFRLATEPRRLWKRYLVYNSKFLFAIAKREIRRGASADLP